MASRELYQKLLTRVQALQDVHYRCAETYSKYNMYLFLPSITITTMASIGSFLAASDYLNEDTQTIFSLSVGILTILSSMMQSVNNTIKYPAKIESHQLAGEEYSKLLTRLQFEFLNPDEEDFFSDIEEKILDIKNKCKYYPLRSIVDKYKDKLSLDHFTSPSNSRDNSARNLHIIDDALTTI